MPASCATRAEFLAVAPEFSSYGPTSTATITANPSTPGDRLILTSAAFPQVTIEWTAVVTSPILGSQYLSDPNTGIVAQSLADSINAQGQFMTATASASSIFVESVQTGVDGLHEILSKPGSAFILSSSTLEGGAALIDQALACACSQINLECWGAKAQCAHVYLTAHMLTVANGGEAGPVNRRKIDKIEESFSNVVSATGLDPSFATTKWGRLYLQLKKSLFIAPVPGRRFLVSPNTLRGWRW